ncbi:MAG: peptide deformylase [Bacteroidales bacterium]|nr:peptide deformylase [Bacteroidales bacterium]
MFRKILILFLAGCIVAACRIGFTPSEREIISRSDSVMYVTTIWADSAVLRTPSLDLSPSELKSPEFQVLVSKMMTTVLSPEQDGVGIAAPQVGINRRLAIVWREDKSGQPFEVYANVRIDSLWGEMTHGPEGCLSVPPYRGLVPRYPNVIVSYTDTSTLLCRRDTVRGYSAIIFQHECDHLDGRLYIDRADTVFYNDAWAREREQFDYSRPSWMK